jgi:HicA toxin of bacterial toxin-antitoxin,
MSIHGYYPHMNKSHRKTLNDIFSQPVPATLEWRKIESLFVSLGAQTIEGAGSRVRFDLNGIVAAFHRPHPAKEAKPYQVKDAKTFLENAGVKP